MKIIKWWQETCGRERESNNQLCWPKNDELTIANGIASISYHLLKENTLFEVHDHNYHHNIESMQTGEKSAGWQWTGN